MDLRFSPEEENFRAEVADWLAANLTGRFAAARGLGGPGREHEAVELRQEWEKELGRAGWTCLGWPKEYGGRGASLTEQVIFHEEYVRAQAPTRVGHIGEGLIGPTLIALGTEAQKERFLPPIVAGEELWCQGYSEPGAGSDLAGVSTRARLIDGQWRIDGQKVWTSLAHEADWAFVLVRTDPASTRHAGLTYLLVPMQQPGHHGPADRSAHGYERIQRGVLRRRANRRGLRRRRCRRRLAGCDDDAGVRARSLDVGPAALVPAGVRPRPTAGPGGAVPRTTRCYATSLSSRGSGLEIMRLNALRTMTSLGAGEQGPEVSIAKLYWSNWHRDFGELAMAVLGEDALVAEAPPYELSLPQRLFLFSRSDTIYAGSNEIQRNIIAERTLGLPRSRPTKG